MSNPLQTRFNASLPRAEAWLRSRGFELKPVRPGPRFRAGFSISLPAGGKQFPMDVLFEADYPISPPRLRISPTFRGQIPHVEIDGQLCLFQNGTEFDVYAVEAVLEATFLDAERVLSQPLTTDFVEEFQSYWPDALSTGVQTLVVLCDVHLGMRMMVSVLAKNVACSGADRRQVVAWLRKSFVANPTRLRTNDVVLVHLSTGLVPADYPRTLSGLLDIARNNDTDAYNRLAHQACNSSGDKLVILCFRHNGQQILGGLRFASPSLANRKEVRAQFGRGPLPPEPVLAMAKATVDATHVIRMQTSSATHRHIHSRGGAGHSLQNKTVALVGCGALGSHIAHLLAKAGVGQLYLIDPQILTRDNIGRNLLGSAHVGMPKATALSRHLLQQLPHLSIVARTQPWREVWDSNPSVFLRCDLVISSVGHWNTEFDLNVLTRRATGFPPVVFGWIEAHAAAGHSLFVHSSMGGCFACGCNNLGTFNASVIDPAHDTGRRGAGCGDFFQPYGAAEMIPTASMIVQQSIDAVTGRLLDSQLRSWTGSKDTFALHSLPVTSQWQDAVNAQPFGGSHRCAWPPVTSCRFCR